MKWRRILIAVTVLALLAVLAPMVLAGGGGGFDEYGYNRTARVFVGTGQSWCEGKGLDPAWCAGYLGPYINDRIVMKWNAEWDRGNAEKWLEPPYNAWENNEWNGMFPGGSGETWHYKIVWYGPCTEGDTLPEGGYCLWGQFQVISSHGTADGEHVWEVLAQPAGYGAY